MRTVREVTGSIPPRLFFTIIYYQTNPDRFDSYTRCSWLGRMAKKNQILYVNYHVKGLHKSLQYGRI